MPKGRRKEFEVEGEKFLFKIPDFDDVWAVLGKMPTLPGEERGENGKKSKQAEMLSSARNADLAAALLVRVAISPKLIEDSPAEIPEGSFPVREIRYEDRMRIFAELMADSGFSTEAAEGIRPFSETGEGSSTSTGSGSDTAAPLPAGSRA